MIMAKFYPLVRKNNSQRKKTNQIKWKKYHVVALQSQSQLKQTNACEQPQSV